MRMTLVALIVQETLQRLQQKCPKSPFVSISGLNETTFDHSAKKILGQILCVRNGVALAADKSENWSPVNLAKFGEGSMGLRFIACRFRAGQNDAPACRHKSSMGVGKGGI